MWSLLPMMYSEYSLSKSVLSGSKTMSCMAKRPYTRVTVSDCLASPMHVTAASARIHRADGLLVAKAQDYMLSDDENLAKGCQFPFLSDDDLKGLRDDTVIAHEVPQGWAVEDVIGINHGIGVDNALWDYPKSEYRHWQLATVTVYRLL